MPPSSRAKVSCVCIAKYSARATTKAYSISSSASPKKPELLADHRKDEVGGALRQELQLRLAAVHPALAKHAARADRDLRLDDVIARAQAVGARVEKGEHALFLVVVHERPAEPAAEAAEARRAAAMMRTCSPAMTMTRLPAIAISAAVPRSGCSATRPTGTKMSATRMRERGHRGRQSADRAKTTRTSSAPQAS